MTFVKEYKKISWEHPVRAVVLNKQSFILLINSIILIQITARRTRYKVFAGMSPILQIT
jgi:hypothetical protein